MKNSPFEHMDKGKDCKMEKEALPSPGNCLPWEGEYKSENCPDTCGGNEPDDYGMQRDYEPSETYFHICDISTLLDRIVMDIQHLEIEIIRTRYKLSYYLKPPYDEYLRMEIFSGLGDRYLGDPVYDAYLWNRGFSEYEDAIDTPFHANRKRRLSKGYDDYPDLYP